MNVISLTGNATKDVELTVTPSGTKVAKGTIAVRRDFKNQQGEYETDFINFVSLGNISDVLVNHIKKGDRFGITGRLQIRTWDNDQGQRQYFTEVVVNGFDFPEKRSQQEQSRTQERAPQSNTRVDKDPFSNDSQPIDIDDDSLPF